MMARTWIIDRTPSMEGVLYGSILAWETHPHRGTHVKRCN
jgi:hypothetical protein